MEVQFWLAPRMDEMGEEVKRSQWGRTVDIFPRGAAALKGVASQRVYQCRQVNARRHESADTKMTGGSASCSLCDLCSPRADWCHG